MRQPWRVAIVGGGITGLAAAVRLRDRAPADTEITVYEQSGLLGGKLRTGELAGQAVEFGAESFLLRDPAGGESAAVTLVRRVGVGDAIVPPPDGQAALAVDGRLRPVPGGTLVGVPGDLEKVAAVAAPTADADRDGGRPLLGPDEDVAVGALVRDRLGDQVVDRRGRYRLRIEGGDADSSYRAILLFDKDRVRQRIDIWAEGAQVVDRIFYRRAGAKILEHIVRYKIQPFE